MTAWIILLMAVVVAWSGDGGLALGLVLIAALARGVDTPPDSA